MRRLQLSTVMVATLLSLAIAGCATQGDQRAGVRKQVDSVHVLAGEYQGYRYPGSRPAFLRVQADGSYQTWSSLPDEPRNIGTLSLRNGRVYYKATTEGELLVFENDGRITVQFFRDSQVFGEFTRR